MKSAKQEAKEQNAELKAGGKSSRDAMLAAIRQNQPAFTAAPEVPYFAPYFDDVLHKYTDVLTGIGGQVYIVDKYEDIHSRFGIDFADAKRVVSFDPLFAAIAEIQDGTNARHQFQNADVCIVSSSLAVAENGAVWITENELPERVLPFIAQSLVAVVHKKNIVATMHDAYNIIGNTEYGFAVFIAGPSKTADIEQSLVLGAHGPKTMTVFIIRE